MEKLHGIDLDSARKSERQRLLLSLWRHCKTPLCGALICARFYDRQRLHILRSAVYDKRNVVNGVMSFSEWKIMMYKSRRDLYLIGTSEHSMIGKFIDTITPEAELPKSSHKLFALLPQEVGAHA